MGRKKSLFGVSYSWKKATGVTKLKRKIAKATGIPTSKSGRKRKLEQKTSLLYWLFGSGRK